MSPLMLNPEKAYWLLALGLLVLGGVFGSFLNVVVYRLPAGMSLVTPGSHCPVCKHPVRWFDNVPVLGWIVLGGHCRDCRGRSQCAIRWSRPSRPGCSCCWESASPFPAARICRTPRNSSWRNSAWRSSGPFTPVTCSCSARCWPRRWFNTTATAAARAVPAGAGRGIAGPYWPMLHPVMGWPAIHGPWTGVAAGILLLWLTSGRRSNGLPAGIICVGLILGWQAAGVLAVLTVAVGLLFQAATRRRPELRRLPWTAWLALGTLGWILAWGWLARTFLL